MPEKVLKTFEIKYLQVLDETGKCDEKLCPRELDEKLIKKMYEAMLLTRKSDDVSLKLQREGRMLTYASTRGQEAQVGVAFALKDDDWFFPSFREHGVLMARGVPISTLMLYWMGDENGSKFPGNNFMMTVPVSTQVPHAVGAAWAMKLQGKKTATMVFFGDGGSSKADFYEGANFAGVFNAPVVLVCQNNQWAISVPRAHQTKAETIAQKAIAVGFEGIQVDGNDVIAVYLAAKRALEKARSGGGPTLIEMFTYRMSDHTTSDDSRRYRDIKEVEQWAKKDPIDRLRKFMEKNRWWTEKYQKDIEQKIGAQVDAAVKAAESAKPPGPTEMFDYTFEQPTPNLNEQRGEVKRFYG